MPAQDDDPRTNNLYLHKRRSVEAAVLLKQQVRRQLVIVVHDAQLGLDRALNQTVRGLRIEGAGHCQVSKER